MLQWILIYVFMMPHMFGILNFLGLSRIGNWKWEFLAWSSFILFPFVGVLWILCGGTLPPKGSLRYDPTTLFWFSLLALISPGEVWNSKVPSRVAFFIWIAALRRILTTDNLQRRRIIILDWCCIVNRMVSMLITFLCTVVWLRSFGM